jgi:uncharacterized protein (TIGR03083 family)
VSSAHRAVTPLVARETVADVASRFAALLRAVPDAAAPAVGAWTVGDVAAHVTHVAELDASAAQGRVGETLRALGVQVRVVDDVAHLTAAMLGREPSRDPAKLAQRFEDAVSMLLSACSGDDRDVPWLLGISLKQSAICGHLVSEVLVHGWDVARGSGLPWRIAREPACVAIEGFYAVAIPATGDSDRPAGPRGTAEIRLRGGGRFVITSTDTGPAVLPTSDHVDLRISADPATMLLAMSGRGGSRLRRLLSGRMAVWGRRPLRGLRMLESLHVP